MESEGVVPHRYVVAGTILVAGFLFGLVLVGMFRWYPYFWQWIAYHNGLAVVVFIYLLLASDRAEPPIEGRPFVGYARARPRARPESGAVLLPERE